MSMGATIPGSNISSNASATSTKQPFKLVDVLDIHNYPYYNEH